MNIDEIKELMAHLEQSKIGKIIVKRGDFEVHLEKEISSFAPARESHVRMDTAISRVQESMGEKGGESPGLFVTSPMVGTYYVSSGPDQSVFVKVGDKVHEGTVMCIIEAMKVMNEVKAGISGIVTEVLVHNAQPVEFGTRLFRIVGSS